MSSRKFGASLNTVEYGAGRVSGRCRTPFNIRLSEVKVMGTIRESFMACSFSNPTDL